MTRNQTHRKVPCGGWILEREADAHIKRCEMCEAMLEYRQEEFNYRANIVGTVLLTVVVVFFVWLWMNF
jgi:hypothetical protein